MPTHAAVYAAFDNLQSKDIRFLQEAAKVGPVDVWLRSDAALTAAGRPARFPEVERLYLVGAIRHVHDVRLASSPAEVGLPKGPGASVSYIQVVREADGQAADREWRLPGRLPIHVVSEDDLAGFPAPDGPPASTGRPRVIVTGCFDWLHSGHVRFFEQASQFGDLFVVVGHDENVRLLKGPAHPMLPAHERRYVVGSIRFVQQALIATGQGWMDAAPEVARIRPDVYVVNEDGDKADKRDFCARHGMRYVVLSRTPKDGLPPRTSTELRGF